MAASRGTRGFNQRCSAMGVAMLAAPQQRLHSLRWLLRCQIVVLGGVLPIQMQDIAKPSALGIRPLVKKSNELSFVT